MAEPQRGSGWVCLCGNCGSEWADWSEGQPPAWIKRHVALVAEALAAGQPPPPPPQPDPDDYAPAVPAVLPLKRRRAARLPGWQRKQAA